MQIFLKLIAVTLIFELISCSESNGQFTIVGSKLLRRNKKYNVAITSQNFNDAILEVSIESTNKSWEGKPQNITLNGKAQNLTFDMKDQPLFGDYHLLVKGIQGVNYERIEPLHMNTRNVSAFVQTDKAVYRPSDTVKFRVLVLNEHLKPLNDTTTIQIYVTDAAQNRVKQFNDIVIAKGAFQGSLKLSDYPILGNGSIVVVVYNKNEALQRFEVAEHSSPPFLAGPYQIRMIKKEEKFKPGLPFTVTAKVLYPGQNEPFTDKSNPINFTAAFRERRDCLDVYKDIEPERSCKGGNSFSENFSIYPSEGVAQVNIQIPEKIVALNITAKYLEAEVSEIGIQRPTSQRNHFIRITSKTQTPTLDKNVRISILSVKSFTEFSYHVLSNADGRVIISDTIKVNLTKTHDFEFTPTEDMESDVRILVFYIAYYGEVVYDSLDLEFQELSNFVDVQVSQNRTAPDVEIDITITSKNGSFVGLSCVDQSEFLLKGGNDINASPILDKIEEDRRKQSEVFFIKHPDSTYFINFGGHSAKSKDIGNLNTDVTIRQEFGETWLFELLTFGPDKNSTVITRIVPNRISSSVITAFSINPITGFAMTKHPAIFSVFKEIFVTMDSPYSIKRNEIVSIPISVFNNKDNNETAIITMLNDDNDIEFVDETNETELSVKGKSGNSTSIKIRATKVGLKKIKFKATNKLSKFDGLEKNVLVKPEGFTVYVNQALVIDLRKTVNFTGEIRFDIPVGCVNQSIKTEASVNGDLILALHIGNVNKLIKPPNGGGEQNMLNFVLNVAVLDYLTAINKSDPETTSKAITFLKTGYQAELAYKHDNGSYSEWGNSDRSGSTWLTAFVAKSFHQAAKHITVDLEIIENAFAFLSQTQSENGSFVEVGKITHGDIQGGSSNGIALTAYILLTFLENEKFSETDNATIRKASSFLNHTSNDITDNYSLAIAAYALQLVDPKNGTLLSKLEAKAIKDGYGMRWVREVSKSQDNSFSKASALDIETTAYALKAFLKAGAGKHTNITAQIMKWLISQRNENGGFVSHQDTVVGLQALSKVAETMYSGDHNMTIELNSNNANEPVHTYYVNETNALLLQKKKILHAKVFNITAQGNGVRLFEISYQYNIPCTYTTGNFNITYDVSKEVAKNTFLLKVCTNYTSDAISQEPEALVMEVRFLNGYSISKDSLKRLNGITKVHDYEESVVVDLNSTNDCLEFGFVNNEHPVDVLKPALIILYGSNNPKACRCYKLP